jgi:hypothetical protein
MRRILTKKLKETINAQSIILGSHVLDHYNATVGSFDAEMNNLATNLPTEWRVKKDENGPYLFYRPSHFMVGTPYGDYKFRAEIPEGVTYEEGATIKTEDLPPSTKFSITLDLARS